MRHHQRIRSIAGIAALALLPTVDPASLSGQMHGTTFTASFNICPNPVVCDEIPSSWLDDRPGASAFLTPNWNPPGSSGIYFDRNVSTTYASIVPIPPNFAHLVVGTGGGDPLPGASFNLLAFAVPPGCVHLHVASAGNIQGNVTFLDRPALNGNPAAQLQVQEVLDEVEPRVLGVYYNSASNNRWGIFNQDGTAMAAGRAFWVMDATCTVADGGAALILSTAPCAPSGGFCYIDAPAHGNGRPGAVLLVTQLWSFSGQVYNPHPVGVWYNDLNNRWAIFNEDNTAIPSGARFFVWFISAIFTSDFETADLSGWLVGAP